MTEMDDAFLEYDPDWFLSNQEAAWRILWQRIKARFLNAYNPTLAGQAYGCF
ncbi:hypothetical protein ACOJD8_001513 [Cronobacter turicensis]|uniref:hypothetical protein n=1 Tax=Cronobacter turicensis TaxID=413502 RepID=UPI002938B175|nr:hypothetical protein [Cronobacter turicensis]ELQ6271601.1 hypothetical protein [Cronobacter turicensis]ELY2741380.1 hypothetical protein [Cronobacter turicensis]ELY2782628.1 hypothetical protein [Cronobacter turicensis]ELY4574949.1 hypothetical protein [Cronobacter turicensis]